MHAQSGRSLRDAAILLILAVALGVPATGQALTTNPILTLEGSAASDILGHESAPAGDVNGDGYGDLIVGASQKYVGGVGRAYVHFLGPGADTIPDLTLTGTQAGSQFGWSVAGAGDVNRDGYDDVVVGAPGYTEGAATNAGRVYVFLGRQIPDATADLVIVNAGQSGDGFGSSVAGAGDVNGDGYDDWIVGMPGAGTFDDGNARVYLGSATLNGTFDAVITGNVGDALGTSVAGAGDVNGDGFDDVVIGSSLAGGTDQGEARLYGGRSSIAGGLDLLLSLAGPTSGGWFGISVAGVGDVNADGYADFLVGERYGVASRGTAYLYLGAGEPSATSAITLIGEVPGDLFGSIVRGAGDMDGDGFADFMVSAADADIGPRADAGRVYVYRGGTTLSPTPTLTFEGTSSFDYLGDTAVGLGDVDGDGYGDLAIAAPAADGSAGADVGRVRVVSVFPYRVLFPNGGEQWVAGRHATVRWLGHDIADLELSTDGGGTWSTLAFGVGGQPENEHAIVVPAGVTEFARVRATYAGQAASRSTSDASDRVFAIVAPIEPPPAAARVAGSFLGQAPDDRLGFPVAAAGDVNGDGYPDFLIGARLRDDNGTNSGQAYLHFGGPSVDSSPDVTFTGEAAGDNLGFALSSAGDVNGDGYDDVLVGAFGNDGGATNAGRAYLHFGGSVMDNVPDLVLAGPAVASYLFGHVVAAAGDLNGDGFDDFAVGVPAADESGLIDNGAAYIYYGGPTPDGTADITLTGAFSSDQLGLPIAPLGDVNGDGFDDVGVSASIGAIAGAGNPGLVHVLFGGRAPDATPDLTLRGEFDIDLFGFGLTAGDFNGDGAPDIAVGAPRYDRNGALGLDLGRVYFYYGGAQLDATPDLILQGSMNIDNFGVSASSGDLNCDGYADLIAAAVHNQSAGGQTGRVYVYFGGPGMDAAPDWIQNGPRAFSSFGESVAFAGDVLGDGCGDLLIGATFDDEAAVDAGKATLYDWSRYHLTAPVGGETWPVGALRTVRWSGRALADLSMSVDGGRSYSLLAAGLGGRDENAFTLRVPHSPTRFARIKVQPVDLGTSGADASDSLFTIQTSVALLALLAAPAPQGESGATVSWQTNPGPADLAGYRLERAAGGEWRTLVSLTRETSVTDPQGGPGSRYRLFAVNGYNEELWLGETAIAPRAPLAAWPLPYRGGDLSISYAAAAAPGGRLEDVEVMLFDVSGRLVRRIAKGTPSGMNGAAIWDGRDERGQRVSAGVYFLRARGSSGSDTSVRVVVLR